MRMSEEECRFSGLETKLERLDEHGHVQVHGCSAGGYAEGRCDRGRVKKNFIYGFFHF